MQGIELIVALLLASTVLAGVARAIHVHYAIVLVLGGLAVGLVSGTSAPQVDPHTVLFVFLPPLIYAASFSSSTQDLRTHARTIGLLAVGLVLLSMTAVAAVAHAVAGIGWGPALVLGAILGPTDPIAATSVLRRLGAPARISTILEGEALINDGTGLTVYKLAVAAVVSGHFSPGAGIVKFIAVAAGGVAVGLAAGWVSVEVRKRIDEPQIEISISLLTAYLAYIPADRIGASGVLAAVAAGLYTGGRAGSMLSPTSRLRTLGFWEALTFLLESVLFLLIGLELPHITRGLSVEKPLFAVRPPLPRPGGREGLGGRAARRVHGRFPGWAGCWSVIGSSGALVYCSRVALRGRAGCCWSRDRLGLVRQRCWSRLAGGHAKRGFGCWGRALGSSSGSSRTRSSASYSSLRSRRLGLASAPRCWRAPRVSRRR